jgi:hypothetical protein
LSEEIKIDVKSASVRCCNFSWGVRVPKGWPSFSSIYSYFAGVNHFFFGTIAYIVDSVQLGYQWIMSSFESISDFFVPI